MQKLVSKNPILRFKLGNRIKRLLYAGTMPNLPAIVPKNLPVVVGRSLPATVPDASVRVVNLPAKSTPNTVSAARPATSSVGRVLGKVGRFGRFVKGSIPVLVGSIIGDKIGTYTWNKAYEHAYNLGIQLREQNKLRLRTYLDTASTVGAFGGPDLSNMDNIQEVRLSRPAVAAKPKQRSGWSYGYDRSNEISDIKATQQMLKDAGFDIGKYGVDGKWGKDTENAYLQYLALKNVPEFNPTEISPEQTVDTNSPTIQLPQAPVMLRQAISDYSNYASNLKSALGNNNNFQGLSDLVWKEYADDDNSFAANFSRDMRTRFKNYNTQLSWLDNQSAIEKLLNISGRYRGSRSGDYGDLARSQASWAGEYNQGVDKLNLTALNNYNALINKYKRTIGGYKIGGQLVSRNPITRFKNKKK